MVKGLLLHSVSYSGTWGQPCLTIEKFIDRAADLGFDGVMLMAKRPHLSVLDYDRERCLRLRDHIARRGLRHICVAGYTNFTADLARPDIPQLEFQVAHAVELTRMAYHLGAESVRLFTGYEESVAPFCTQWNMVVAALRETAIRSAKWGVTIGVQNHHDLAVDAQSLRDLIEEVGQPNCRAMFDAWAPALQGEDLAAAARVLAPISVHTTIANYQSRARYRYIPSLVNYETLTARAQAVPMRDGFIDYPVFFEALNAGGFTGTVAYEMCSPLLGGASLENLDRYAANFLEYMDSHCGVSRPASTSR